MTDAVAKWEQSRVPPTTQLIHSFWGGLHSHPWLGHFTILTSEHGYCHLAKYGFEDEAGCFGGPGSLGPWAAMHFLKFLFYIYIFY